MPSYCHYRRQTASSSSLHKGHDPFCRNTVPLWREGASRGENPPYPFLVIACCRRGADCNCPSEKLQLCSGRGDQNHRQGVPVPPPAWLPRGGGQAPSGGARSLCPPCPRPHTGWPRAGPSGCWPSGEPGAASPLWGIFTRKVPAVHFVLSNARSCLYS